MIQTIFLGGLGVIAETSELHRKSFNMAFQEMKLPVYWSQEKYQLLLKYPGGLQRVSDYLSRYHPEHQNMTEKVYQAKQEYFEYLLRLDHVNVRPGIDTLISASLQKQIRLFIVSTTQEHAIVNVLKACNIPFEAIERVFSADDITQPKPSPDIYIHACSVLSIHRDDVMAIEDSASGVAAACSALVPCYAFPGENTQSDDYSKAKGVLERADDILVTRHLHTRAG